MRRAAAILLFTGCASLSGGAPEKCEALEFEIFVQGADLMNVNTEGQSMPVEVRTYFLGGRDAIEHVDFETVWQKAAEGLGPDLIKTTSFTVRPGEEKITTVSVGPTVRYVAIVGLFRQVEGEQWRRIVDVRTAAERCAPGALHSTVRATVQDNRIVAQERIE